MITENAPSSTPCLITYYPATAKRFQTNPKQFGTINHRELDRLNDLPGSAIRVYIALANHANLQGYCWPGRARLAALTRLHLDQVSRALKQLEEAGLIKRLGNSRYLLPLHPLAKPSAPKPRRWQNRQTEQTSFNKPTESALPHAPCPETPPPAPAPSRPLAAQRTGTPDTLPVAWIEAAQQQRPDLPREAIQTSGDNFLDYHRSRGTQSADWFSEWRRWIRRERLPRSAPVRTSQPPERIAVYHQPCQLVELTEAEKQAEQDAWRARMRKLGVDPDTGARLPPAPAPRTVTPPLAGHLAELRAALHTPASPD
ncbi:MAG: helix-turn-helix domain-containing protein [Candidatus Competibacteraceae bacterium]|nr:helix-turn-helix domain-containing protein [Candidatus Competibacteraceae bacterium]MCB1819956.1 helix-turn-helix domain-containing protein [Candidatus Competibacteraceae bacterium]